MDRCQHPTNNDVLGAPPGVKIEDCYALPITRATFSDGTPAVISFWQPTVEEQKLLAEGKPVRLCLLGQTHAPINLGVDGDGEILP